jgi:hypothetical protein
VRDGLAKHWRESYVCRADKSMKAVELATALKDGRRKIAIALIDRVVSAITCFRPRYRIR